jgi:hypothetical protein
MADIARRSGVEVEVATFEAAVKAAEVLRPGGRLDQMPTHGHLTRLPPDKLTEVLDGVGAAIDAMGGGFTMPYITMAVTAARTSTP